MDTYGRIEQLLKKNRISAYKLSQETGISTGLLSQWKKRTQTPSTEKLKSVASYFDVSIDYLLTGEAQKENAPGTKAKGVRISVLGRVAAGVPIEAIEEEVDWEDIPIEWTRGGQKYFGLKVKGDSMYPKYIEGDTVIVRKAADCDSGQDCVVYVDGYDATLKTVKKNDDGSLELIPFNREYPPKTYTKEEVSELPIGICGVVVELRRKV